MPSFTIIKHADIKALPLDPKGQRAGADQGDPQIAVRLWCALLVLKFLCAFIICSDEKPSALMNAHAPTTATT